MLSSGAAPENQGAAHNPNLAQVYQTQLKFGKAAVHGRLLHLVRDSLTRAYNEIE